MFPAILAIFVFLFAGKVPSGCPDCAGIGGWATSMAYVHLKNEGLVGSETLNFNMTTTTRIACEKIGKDLYKQVHLVTFTKLNGDEINVMTVNDASNEECSMSDVDVYVISKILN